MTAHRTATDRARAHRIAKAAAIEARIVADMDTPMLAARALQMKVSSDPMAEQAADDLALRIMAQTGLSANMLGLLRMEGVMP